MAPATGFRRRDPRYVPTSEAASLEYKHPAKGVGRRARLTNVSVAGLAFELEEPDLEKGTILPNVVVRVGHCHLEGDVLVKNVRQTSPTSWEVGGFFYPETEEVERSLMAFLSGIEATRAD